MSSRFWKMFAIFVCTVFTLRTLAGVYVLVSSNTRLVGIPLSESTLRRHFDRLPYGCVCVIENNKSTGIGERFRQRVFRERNDLAESFNCADSTKIKKIIDSLFPVKSSRKFLDSRRWSVQLYQGGGKDPLFFNVSFGPGDEIDFYYNGVLYTGGNAASFEAAVFSACGLTSQLE